jgi:hypothetical protein
MSEEFSKWLMTPMWGKDGNDYGGGAFGGVGITDGTSFDFGIEGGC